MNRAHFPLSHSGPGPGKSYSGYDGRDPYLVMEICCWRWRLVFVLFTLFCLTVIFLSARDNCIALDWHRSAVRDSSEKAGVRHMSLADILMLAMRSARDVTRLDGAKIKSLLQAHE